MTNLFNSKDFFINLKSFIYLKSYFNPKKTFIVKGDERVNEKGLIEKLIETTGFDKKLYWICERDCLGNGIIML